MVFTVECDSCRGRGRINSSTDKDETAEVKVECPACAGSGVVHVDEYGVVLD